MLCRFGMLRFNSIQLNPIRGKGFQISDKLPMAFSFCGATEYYYYCCYYYQREALLQKHPGSVVLSLGDDSFGPLC